MGVLSTKNIITVYKIQSCGALVRGGGMDLSETHVLLHQASTWGRHASLFQTTLKRQGSLGEHPSNTSAWLTKELVRKYGGYAYMNWLRK